jgi:hypothetical protein
MATQEITIKLSHEVKVFLTDLMRQLSQSPRPARLANGGVVGSVQLQATAIHELDRLKTELASLAEEIDTKGTYGLGGSVALAERLRRLAR